MSIGIGETLREARERVGVRLADAAAETRIRQSHLVALEEENFAVIGGDVYVKGFIRSYARHLGVDPEPLVQAYQEHYGTEEADDAWVASARQPVESPPPPRRPITTIVVALAVLMIGGLALLGLLVPDEPEETNELAAPDPVGGDEEDPEGNEDEGDPGQDPGEEGDEDEQDRDDGPGGRDGEGDEEGGAPDMSDEIVLTLSVPDGRSWASITVDGQQVEAANLESGYSETYVGEEIVIRVGDAAHVSLEVNGEDLGRVGDSGAVVDIVCSTAVGECEIG